MPFSSGQKHQRLRGQLWSILHDGKGMSGHAFHLALVILIIVSLALIPLEFISQLHAYHDTLLTIEIFTAACFTMEYVLRIYAAPNRWKFVFSFYGLIDLLSIAPFYLGFLGTQYLRSMRLMNVIRVLKIGEMEAAAAEEETETTERGMGLLAGENVEYIVSRHPLFLIVGCIPPVVATMIAIITLIMTDQNPVAITVATCLFLLALLFLWKAWLDFSYDVIYVTNRRLILQNQYMLGRSINQVNYQAITNVKPYYTSWMGYVMGYGNIVIETMAAEPGHIELHTVRHHERAAHKIMEHCFQAELPRSKQSR